MIELDGEIRRLQCALDDRRVPLLAGDGSGDSAGGNLRLVWFFRDIVVDLGVMKLLAHCYEGVDLKGGKQHGLDDWAGRVAVGRGREINDRRRGDGRGHEEWRKGTVG